MIAKSFRQKGDSMASIPLQVTHCHYGLTTKLKIPNPGDL